MSESDERGTVILDLSNVAIEPGANGRRAAWWRVEALLAEWKRRVHPAPAVAGVADRSLRHKLDPYGLAQLNRWQRQGQAEVLPWADPLVCELAQEDPSAFVVSNDQFRGLRGEFPFLQGFDRLYRFEILADRSCRLARGRLEVLDAAEISRAQEDEIRTPRHLRDPEGARLLRFEWACDNAECVWAGASAIEELPVNNRGVAHCPACGEALRQVGPADMTRELKLIVDGAVLERVPVPVGASLTIGRSSGTDVVDARELMDPSAAKRISRRHVQIANVNGRVRVCDLGSTNSSSIRRPDGSATNLEADRIFVLDEGCALDLPGTLSVELSGKRYARGQYVGRLPEGNETSAEATVYNKQESD